VLLGEQVSPWAPVFASGVALAVWVGQKQIRPASAPTQHRPPAPALSTLPMPSRHLA
jgi:negative regulator of sigma E activity